MRHDWPLHPTPLPHSPTPRSLRQISSVRGPNLQTHEKKMKRFLQGNNSTTSLVRKAVAISPVTEGPLGRPSRPFDDLVRIYMPFLARLWSMHACHAAVSCNRIVTPTLEMLGTLILVGSYERQHKIVGATLPHVSCTPNLSSNNSLACITHSLGQQPWCLRQR